MFAAAASGFLQITLSQNASARHRVENERCHVISRAAGPEMTLVNLPGCTALHRRFSALVLSNKAGMKQGTNLQAPSTDERDQRITAGRRSDLDDWGIYRNRDFCNTGLQKARRTRRAAVIGLGFNGRFGHFIAGAMPTAEFLCEAGPSTASCY